MNVSFGRIIPVKSITNPSSNNSKKKVDNSTYEVAKVLNSENSSIYSKSQAESIRNFFKSVLCDYNGKDGILIRRTKDGDLFMLSGKDAKKHAQQEKQKKKNNAPIEFSPDKGKDAEIIFSSSKFANREFTLEGRKKQKPPKVKIDQFQYIKAESYYTAQLDGFIRKDVKETKKPTLSNRCENVIVNFKELILK